MEEFLRMENNINSVKLKSGDISDYKYIIEGLNTCMDYVRRPLPVDLTDDRADAYYAAVFSTFKDFKVKEHSFRKKIVEDYKVPYDSFLNLDEGLIIYKEV